MKKTEIMKLIEQNDYEGIRDQDGWETLELTIRHNHSPEIANSILSKLSEM